MDFQPLCSCAWTVASPCLDGGSSRAVENTSWGYISGHATGVGSLLPWPTILTLRWPHRNRDSKSSYLSGMASVSEDKSTTIIGVVAFCLLWVTFMVSLRLWTRWKIIKQVGVDDYACVSGWVSGLPDPRTANTGCQPHRRTARFTSTDRPSS